MAKHKFTAAERYGVWWAHESKCYWCSEPIDFTHVTVDHLVPESADAATLAKAITDYALPSTFAINAFENWVPAHSSCNSKKGNTLYPPGGVMVRLFADAGKRAPVARAQHDAIVAMPKKGKILAKIEAAVDLGTITVEDIKVLLADASAKNLKQLLIANRWVQMSRNGSMEIVTDGNRIGTSPVGNGYDPSWECGFCRNPGPWSGARCLSCGNMSDPD